LPLLSGCPTVLIPTMDFMRDPSLWLWAIHRYRGAHSWAPNFGYSLCVTRIADEDLEGLDLSSWRIAVSAAEPILASTLEEFTRRFSSYGFDPRAITPVYGLAENVTAVTCHPVDEPERVEVLDRRELALHNVAELTAGEGLACVSDGKCLPDYEIEIRDSGGARLPDRHVGIIWARTPSLFKGYHRDPEATRLALVDGWLNTGDRGYMAEDHLFFVSRDKDLIVIGGEKYTPHDVEAAVNRVPGVRQGCAIAFGVMSRDRGTEELAVVAETKREDPEALETLTRAIRREVIRSVGLGVRHVKLVPPGGVAKTTSGKLARSATRQRYLEEFDREG
jgi:acyl-CoA synthetase (AMP-forming)/AMP-acid ligase II